ncbi:MAG: hypothetical protein LBQ79_07480 [Deltaproteobacteria bacterium]|nr:hypothetical protein [Deltaproteobacteria bacterium]
MAGAFLVGSAGIDISSPATNPSAPAVGSVCRPPAGPRLRSVCGAVLDRELQSHVIDVLEGVAGNEDA